MDRIMKEPQTPSIKIYNTPIEIGLRSLVILQSSDNQIMDLEKIMYLDYLCLNTADIGGPTSLHAPLPNRGVQVFSKKDLIQKGLSIMLTKELINLIVLPEGFFYQISEAGSVFLKLFQTKYFLDLLDRCQWVLSRWGNESTKQIKLFIDDNIQNWGADFLSYNESDNT
jgi:hypothetical protein